jgi:hypothetical protein
MLKKTNSIMNLPELKQMLKLHKIKGYSHLNKPELIAVLEQNGVNTNVVVLPELHLSKSRSLTPEKLFGYKTSFTGYETYAPRKQPRRVEIFDRETGEVVTYPSIYKAAKAYGQSSMMIAYYNGRVWKDRYEITVQ